jgi:hypothetical protein
MRLVTFVDGALELRWTWLPYWLATNGKLKSELEWELQEFVLSKQLTSSEQDLDTIHEFVCAQLQARFPGFEGLGDALRGFGSVRAPLGVS